MQFFLLFKLSFFWNCLLYFFSHVSKQGHLISAPPKKLTNDIFNKWHKRFFLISSKSAFYPEGKLLFVCQIVFIFQHCCCPPAASRYCLVCGHEIAACFNHYNKHFLLLFFPFLQTQQNISCCCCCFCFLGLEGEKRTTYEIIKVIKPYAGINSWRKCGSNSTMAAE